MQEIQNTQVRFLGQEDPLGEEMATHSSILAWRIPWTEERGGLHPWGRKESDTTEATLDTCTRTQEVLPSLNQLPPSILLHQGEAAQIISVGLLVRPSSRWWH